MIVNLTDVTAFDVEFLGEPDKCTQSIWTPRVQHSLVTTPFLILIRMRKPRPFTRPSRFCLDALFLLRKATIL
jgi:hypothetical protein